ncbi:MAG: helix-turn-helix transcriptional regulator [Chloroflexota bacterium]|nr:helix-turn-helix transcriptional regulator [Chloroflexota bacterium]
MSRAKRAWNTRLRAEVVWEYLTRHNLSQNALARKLDIDPGYFSQMMNGRRYPSPEMRARLMLGLGITDFDDLFVKEAAA